MYNPLAVAFEMKIFRDPLNPSRVIFNEEEFLIKIDNSERGKLNGSETLAEVIGFESNVVEPSEIYAGETATL